PLNIAFYDHEAFGGEYRGDAFVALHGSWNREIRTGYKVVRLPFDDSNEPTGAYEDFMTGFLTAEGEVWGRPVGVAVSRRCALRVRGRQRHDLEGQPRLAGRPNWHLAIDCPRLAAAAPV